MSFSLEVKKEICQSKGQNPCCVTAACYGVACFARSFDAKGLVLRTESAFIAQWAKRIFTEAGMQGKVYVKGESYDFAITDPFEVEKMLAAFGHGGDETSLRIHADNFYCDHCFSAFLGAAFVCAGTVVSPEKGYNLEFASPRFMLMQDFEAQLRARDFAPGRAQRKGSNVLYFKSSEQIEDLLTTMGATGSSLEIMRLKVFKDFRNQANRITNCETANIDKTVAANRQTLQAIQLLARENVLQTLPDTLREAADLRRENPALSLAELARLFPKPVSKSGLSHRYKKIRDIAAARQAAGEATHNGSEKQEA